MKRAAQQQNLDTGWLSCELEAGVLQLVFWDLFIWGRGLRYF
jgi:hypothetical protein